jgi:hypothetical protein
MVADGVVQQSHRPQTLATGGGRLKARYAASTVRFLPVRLAR